MGAQDMIDSRALELATEANTRATGVVEEMRTMNAWMRDHEAHDVERFAAGQKTMTEGFDKLGVKIGDSVKGIYNRLWIFAGALGIAMFTIIMFLLDK